MHGNVARIVARSSHPNPEGDGNPDRGSEVQGEPAVPPLEWMADDSTTVPASREPWGPDAASSPLTYWHWRGQRRLSAVGGTDGELPADAPTLSIVVTVQGSRLPELRQCLSSVVDQTYARWELWLCDAGADHAWLGGGPAVSYGCPAWWDGSRFAGSRDHPAPGSWSVGGHQPCAGQGDWRVRRPT